MSKLSETYTSIIKGIQRKGFNVVCTTEKITVTNPNSTEIIFEGDIDQAEQWLFTKDFSGSWDLKHPPGHFDSPCRVVTIESPPFRRNAIMCAALCTFIMLTACIIPNKDIGMYLGIPGFTLFALAIKNTIHHLKWMKNKTNNH